MRRLRRVRRSLLVAGAAAAILIVVAAGYGYAAVTATNQMYTGCLANGAINNVAIGSTPFKDCAKGSTQISWSQTGPQGGPGVSVTSANEPVGVNCGSGGSKFTAVNGVTYACNGAKGDTGATGANGPNGSNGANGSNGLNGVSVTSAALAAGNTNCPTGGSQFTSVSGNTYACNGAKGDQGDKGDKGDKGDTGAAGPQGVPGTGGGGLHGVWAPPAFGANSWTAPAGVTEVMLELWGAGGGGGCGALGFIGSQSQQATFAGGGGGAGGYLRVVVPVTPGRTYSVNVGFPGDGCVPGGSDATIGGDTFFADAGTHVADAFGGHPGNDYVDHAPGGGLGGNALGPTPNVSWSGGAGGPGGFPDALGAGGTSTQGSIGRPMGSGGAGIPGGNDVSGTAGVRGYALLTW